MWLNVVKSVVISYAFTFICFLVFAVVLAFTGFSDSLIPSIILAISILSIIIGAANCSKRASSQGWIWGASVGCAYSLILYLVGSLLFTGFSSPASTFYLILLCIVFGATGGIIGINLKHE